MNETIAKRPRIGHVYEPCQMCREWFAYVVGYHDVFVVPSTAILVSWTPPVPKLGRIFLTDMVVRGATMWPRERYMRHMRALGEPEYELLAGDDEVRLAEYWRHDGDESGYSYALSGWVFVGRRQLAAAEEWARTRYPRGATTQLAIERVVGIRL